MLVKSELFDTVSDKEVIKLSMRKLISWLDWMQVSCCPVSSDNVICNIITIAVPKLI